MAENVPAASEGATVAQALDRFVAARTERRRRPRAFGERRRGSDLGRGGEPRGGAAAGAPAVGAPTVGAPTVAHDAVDDAAEKFALHIGPFRVPFPNPGKLPIHDVHHVVLGVPATFWGEVQVSAFELRSGPPTALIALLCVGALSLGFLARPAQIARWLRAYGGCTNLYREPDLAPILALDVAVLRARLGISR